VFVDTPAAYPGIESEERGVAEAIATNLRDMMLIETPILVIVSGEGGSGGALGIAIGDRVLMQEFAIYSVIPPEGCAALVWRDAWKKRRSRRGAQDHRAGPPGFGVIDEIIPEPVGGAHTDHDAAAAAVDQVLHRELLAVTALDAPARLEQRYEKFRNMGRLGIEFVDESC
jgi:acetyl-CoA carboxylase carboxyl transferase subunit alpha